MSNDYEYLGDSQMPPPMAPRAPSDAHPDLITGLPHTPALKANDDVDLESNRPPGNNNLSFSDGVNPKRSEPSVATTKSRSTESDENSKKYAQKHSTEEKKHHKCGTCWYIFAGATIFLAVISLLGLGAFLLMNSDSTEPISAALNGTNETTTQEFETTTFGIIDLTTPMPDVIVDSSTVASKPNQNLATEDQNETDSVTEISPVDYTSSDLLTTSDSKTFGLSNQSSTTKNREEISTDTIFTTEDQKSVTESIEPTEKIEETLSIEGSTSASFVNTIDGDDRLPSENTSAVELKTTTDSMAITNRNETSTTEKGVTTEDFVRPNTTESFVNGITLEN